MKLNKQLVIAFFVGMISLNSNCSKTKKPDSDNNPPTNNPTGSGGAIDSWLTTGNQFALLQKQSTQLTFDSPVNASATIEIDSATQYQSVDGFGYSLTGGSAYMINQLSSDKKAALLEELFGSGVSSIGVSYLRISIGASDLNASVFS